MPLNASFAQNIIFKHAKLMRTLSPIPWMLLAYLLFRKKHLFYFLFLIYNDFLSNYFFFYLRTKTVKVMKQKQKKVTMLIRRIILQKMEINHLILKRKRRKPKKISLIRKRKMKSQQLEVLLKIFSLFFQL